MAGQNRPGNKPEWAVNPTTPATAIVEPTQTDKDEGWLAKGLLDPAGGPRRSFVNWFKNLAYQWIEWLDGTKHRPGDLHPDQALPYGTAPSIGAGLIALAADFSASVYANGFRVSDFDNADGVVLSPAHTYPANSDTYWDLTQDGIWTPVPVATAQPPPALTPNSTRVYMVTTNAIDRTVVTDFRVTSIVFNNFENIVLDALSLGTIDFPDLDSASGNDRYNLLTTIPHTGADSNRTEINIYSAKTTSGLSAGFSGITATINAHWNEGTTQWQSNGIGTGQAILMHLHAANLAVYHHPSLGLGLTSWADNTSAGNWERRAQISTNGVRSPAVKTDSLAVDAGSNISVSNTLVGSGTQALGSVAGPFSGAVIANTGSYSFATAKTINERIHGYGFIPGGPTASPVLFPQVPAGQTVSFGCNHLPHNCFLQTITMVGAGNWTLEFYEFNGVTQTFVVSISASTLTVNRTIDRVNRAYLFRMTSIGLQTLEAATFTYTITSHWK